MSLSIYWILTGLCVLGTTLLAVFAVPICHRFDIMDAPGERKLHRTVTPLLGGLALIFVALPLSLAACIPIAEKDLQASLIHYVLAVYALAFIGLADDRHSLGARQRVVLTLVVFMVLGWVDPLFQVRILSFEIPKFSFGLGSIPMALIFTSVCCVGLINAVNMADGKNGLVIGLCLGWLVILAYYAGPAFIPFIVLMMATLAVLLVFNLPGRIFLGDGGSYGFAAAIGLLSIAIYNSPHPQAAHVFSADKIVLMFIVPVLDSFRLTFARILRRQSPMAGDRDHFHHHLLERFGWPMGLLVYWVVALVPLGLVVGYAVS